MSPGGVPPNHHHHHHHHHHHSPHSKKTGVQSGTPPDPNPAPPPSAPSPLLGLATPRMSNAFARRHGLNPKDNPMLNLQKIALQAQVREGVCVWGGQV